MSTPEGELQDAVLEDIGQAEDLLTFVNRRGVAVYTDKRGFTYRVPYGLAAGASDLILIKRVLITPEMVGMNIGQFGAIELKAPGVESTEKTRKKQQTNFSAKIRCYGGFAGKAQSVEEVREIIWQVRKR